MKAIEEVYRQYASTVYRYLLSLTRSSDIAEELTQETFYRAIRASDRYDGSCSITTWLCAIAKRVRLEHARKHPANEDISVQAIPTGSAEEEVMASEGRLEIMRRLHAMPEPTREVMYLRIFGGLAFKEVGEVLGMTENRARVIYYRGKEKLRKELDENVQNTL